MPFGGLLTLGIISGGTSFVNGILGKSAANTAAQQQVDAGNKAIDFQKGVYGDEKQNFADFKNASQPIANLGTTSIAQLMKGLTDGTFGNTPNFQGPADFAAPAPFQAPTAEEARATPGYQFAQQQGSSSVLKGAAAAGGAITGGTLKALDSFGTGLADSTYNNRFNQSLSTYNTNFDDALKTYQTNFGKNQSVFTTNLGKNAQDFSQLFAPAQLAESSNEAVGRIGSTIGQGPAANISDLMTQVGNAKASGTIGGTNALTSGITGGVNDVSQAILLGDLMKKTKSPGGAG